MLPRFPASQRSSNSPKVVVVGATNSPSSISRNFALSHVSASFVAKYRVKSKKPPSQTWKNFLRNHVGQIAAIDFFTIHTLSFHTLYCFIILLHDRRRVVHLNVNATPNTLGGRRSDTEQQGVRFERM